ncbi:3-hydroxy-9,10-secoandrosta-1,3,5(10)-triene-9,17-dione monooxygenase reductase component [Amycolatopsis arida]|uniref:3-hydroxy-9,10-secoandrosta-1,3,5(10)-triene-9,17-dione monooxygenase reductase component n=1 Tax=Amycolatopsis arida TaxID=587909 RepID=A0A1I5VNJ0_9PSEU|nr:3-hydroxy-9,10-secoandrosta-1,3,5(10)-triene-9,17-dione monooxygenase reductase subunit [Amycolatopsis arida]TDX87966.1 3-hydroxy-9,10-secoandrosta-1,3,5(10)-triene-9,17-dione monooxygenase reductase component [Amycolatopsis arida]SFQ09013.1 3-hydroxy-9,10-secoandrosta-1,3,5(10)-triene-9,17-dione monooxygenase reductase component [Amycolatopsis arida]
MTVAGTIDAARFRAVLGHFCTGVTVITAHDGTRPVGFACQSFAALSLDPPLVLFCPARTSRTWPIIEGVGRFAVNVLAADQRAVSGVFGARGEDKFAAVAWRAAASGAPLLDGALTWLDCAVEAVHEAGDHFVVVGRVLELGEIRDGRPLLFYRGRYTATESVPADGDGQVREDLAELLTWPRPDDWF